jgi:hypothetical protein
MEGMKWLHGSLLSLLCFSVVAQEALTWPEATVTSKPWTRWWWLGSAVDEASITQQWSNFLVQEWVGWKFVRSMA